MYRIKVDTSDKRIEHGRLAMGGANPRGETISVNSYYFELNDKPFIPLTGEFQFSRYPCADWDEELLKMKAGGINAVATYVFWIHHEATQGVYDWSQDRDVRRFVELCARRGLYVLLRVGPFAHGECRNGGLPDWLYGQPFEVRSNDTGYLGHVQRFYKQIAEQVAGLLFKDGGPIIGIQVENEYMSSAAPWETVYPERGIQWLPSGRDGGRAHQETEEDAARPRA